MPSSHPSGAEPERLHRQAGATRQLANREASVRHDPTVMSPAAGGNVIGLGLMVMAVGTTIKQLSDGPGISRYFYVRGSADGGFEFAPDDSIDIVRRRIDSFELESLTKDVKRLGYFTAGESVIGAYHDQASWTLWVTRF